MKIIKLLIVSSLVSTVCGCYVRSRPIVVAHDRDRGDHDRDRDRDHGRGHGHDHDHDRH